MKFSQEFLQKIKDGVSIIEIVGEHVVLRKSGSNYSGLCPFHSERSPSFSVSETKQLYHCYGCKKGGDLFAFVMEMHGLSFVEAVQELAERARVPLPADVQARLEGGAGAAASAAAQAQREKQQLAFRLNRFVAAFFHQQLSRLPDSLAYLDRRGVGTEMRKQFYIGGTGTNWDALVHHLKNAQAPLDAAAELGVIRPSQKGAQPGGPGFYDLFRNRVIFPILDLRGKVAGFGGRAMGDETPKYLNSNESLVFQKSKLLYGLHQAQKFIREKDEAVVVEGYFDVVTLHGAGFCNVVATCGTALTADHLQALRRLAKKVTVLFDADRAGIAATQRAMELGLQLGWVLHGASLPDGLDPDELVLRGPEGVAELKERLADAQPLLDRAIARIWSEGKGSAEGQTAALKQIGAWIASYRDPVGRAVRIEQLQKDYQISAALLAQVIPADQLRASVPGISRPIQARSTEARRSPQAHGRPAPPPRPVHLRIRPSERVLLEGLALGGQFIDQLAAARVSLPPGRSLSDLFEHPGIRELTQRLATEPGFLELFRTNPPVALERVEDQQVRSILTESWVGKSDRASEAGGLDGESFSVAIQQRLRWAWARFSHEVGRELGRAEAAKDAELQAKWMKEYLDVQRKMKELGSFYDEA